MLGILTIVVTGLTFLFNLFATIGVSVLAGMMAGASRRWNWQVISVSFLPPLVALALGYFMKAPIDTQRWLYLTGICLGAFWGTWLATYFLMSLEAKSETTPTPQAASLTLAPEASSSPAPVIELADLRVSRAVRVNGEAKPHLSLDDLQGTWRCETGRTDETSNSKLLVVDHGEFSVSIVEASGQAHVIARGELTLHGEGGHKVLIIPAQPGLHARATREV